MNKAVAILIITLFALGTLNAVYLFEPTQAASLDVEFTCEGVVEKMPGESFTVKMTFRNKGTTEGTWRITATFEGDEWTWKGQDKILALKPKEKETVTWEENIPEEAAIESIARLIVYYNDSYMAMNWWIHVVSGAELDFIYSNVS